MGVHWTTSDRPAGYYLLLRLALKESISELREICQRGAAPHPYRSISIYITKLLLYTPITANQTTGLFIVIGLIALWLFTDGIYWKNVLGGALLLFYHILDAVDGEIARYRGSCSTSGLFLDLFGHSLVNSAVFAGISFGIYHQYGDPAIFIPGFVAAISIGVSYATRYSNLFILDEKADSHKGDNLSLKSSGGLKRLVKGLQLRRIISSPVLWATPGITHLALIFALADRMYIMLLFYAVTTPIYLICILYLNYKELRHQ